MMPSDCLKGHNEEAPAAFITVRILFGFPGHPAAINPVPPSCAFSGLRCARAESSSG